ncbi:four-jointed box protein 1-like [Branchiostoma floridae]|uniref:Four-jointed box protein 1-like n=1 Tax=Branchiostoma floridae TaxID=7739 RepID=A0A9J7HNV0_BRAFL|nr:four-jointed box protein 1-like [Branchiostoma floridae]
MSRQTRLYIMVGLAFTLGTLFGLMVQLPTTTREDGRARRHAVPEERAKNSRWKIGQRKPAAIFDSETLGEGGSYDALIDRDESGRISAVSGGATWHERQGGDKSRLPVDPRRSGGGHAGQLNPVAEKLQDLNRPVASDRTGAGIGGNATGKSRLSVRAGFRQWSGVNHTVTFRSISDIVRNGVFWSRQVEAVTPPGWDGTAAEDWMRRARLSRVVAVQEGCGRMLNRLLSLEDGSLSCARYRQNTDQIQGEVFSYYLSRVLEIPNVPPCVLSTVNTNSHQWAEVSHDVHLSQWNEGKLVILSRWADHLIPAYIPRKLRYDDRRLHPVPEDLEGLSAAELGELAQWSDLIVFDYLTANFDRVANNMFNRQWNSQIMDSPVHNLEKSATDGSLVFFDNESGLLHSYRLLDKYAHFHDSLLKSLCVFRKRTAHIIESLHKKKDVGDLLLKEFKANEPLQRWLPFLPDANLRTLNERIDSVYEQIHKCRKTYHVEGR